MSNYATRLKKAREHAGLNQTELAARLHVKPQAIQYLENEIKLARGSKYTASIARICGVDAHWLATGEGSMALGARTAREATASYEALSDEARQVALAWSNLSPANRHWVREMVFILAAVDTRFPWFRRGKPSSKSYAAYERGIEHNYQAQVMLAAGKIKGS